MHSLLLPKQLTLIHPLISTADSARNLGIPVHNTCESSKVKTTADKDHKGSSHICQKRSSWSPRFFGKYSVNSGTSDIKLTEDFIKRDKKSYTRRSSSLVYAAGQLSETNQQVHLWTVGGQLLFTQGQAGLHSLCASVKNVQTMKKSCRGQILFYSTVPKTLDLVG